MNWLKAKRLIRRKPYLLDPYRCRSAEEAQKILDEEGILSPDALLSAARVRAGMSEAEWEAYTGISSEEMRRKIERLTPIRIGKVFSLSRRAAVALIIVVVLALFMACTPIGRAWVVAAYNAIVEVVDGILYIRTDEKTDISRDEPTIESIEDTITYFDSVSDAVEQIEESVTLPRAIFGGGDLFILHTHGDSMIDIGIKHGDLVVIRKQNTAENGDIIVAMMNGETTLKRFYKRNGKVVLHPENKEMKDIIVKDCEIQGVLVSCIHIYN